MLDFTSTSLPAARHAQYVSEPHAQHMCKTARTTVKRQKNMTGKQKQESKKTNRNKTKMNSNKMKMEARTGEDHMHACEDHASSGLGNTTAGRQASLEVCHGAIVLCVVTWLSFLGRSRDLVCPLPSVLSVNHERGDLRE